jgi:hypothetical protein
MLEKQIEAKVCDYAKSKGLLVYKFTSPARAAVPDRMLITPNGHVFFCEFKAAGKKPTEAQAREHQRLQQHKISVFVIDNIDDGKTMVDMMVMGVA